MPTDDSSNTIEVTCSDKPDNKLSDKPDSKLVEIVAAWAELQSDVLVEESRQRPGNWKRFDIGTATHADRDTMADLSGDGRLDLAITEERYPGHVPNGSCRWFEHPSNPTEP